MFLVSSCSCLCLIHWSQVLSREWRCSWSSADRRCSNYIWVIGKIIAYQGVSYIRGLTVIILILLARNTPGTAPERLTNIPLEEMVAISQTTFLSAFSWMKSFILIQISPKFVSKGLIGDRTTLVKVIHHLHQCWSSSLTRICGTRGIWVNM